MIGILTIIIAFVIFSIIMGECWCVSSPVSLSILIIISLFLGYIMAGIAAYLIGVVFIGAIIAIIVLLLKNRKSNKPK